MLIVDEGRAPRAAAVVAEDEGHAALVLIGGCRCSLRHRRFDRAIIRTWVIKVADRVLCVASKVIVTSSGALLGQRIPPLVLAADRYGRCRRRSR